MKKKLVTIILSLGLLAGCEDTRKECYNNYYKDITNYEVKADRYTPKGIGLDDPIKPEHVLDATEVDWQVDDLEACLNRNFAENPVITDEKGHCLRKEFYESIEIKRGCLTVKVPDDLYQSDYSGEWLFPCDIDPIHCEEKGLDDTEYACNCRAMVQDENYIITNHKLNIFRGELARIITSCNNPWVVSQIKGCLKNPHFTGND